MTDDDGIEIKLRLWVPPPEPRYVIETPPEVTAETPIVIRPMRAGDVEVIEEWGLPAGDPGPRHVLVVEDP